MLGGTRLAVSRGACMCTAPHSSLVLDTRAADKVVGDTGKAADNGYRPCSRISLSHWFLLIHILNKVPTESMERTGTTASASPASRWPSESGGGDTPAPCSHSGKMGNWEVSEDPCQDPRLPGSGLPETSSHSLICPSRASSSSNASSSSDDAARAGRALNP